MNISLREIRKEYQKILERLSDPELVSNLEKMEELMRQKSRYEKIIAKQEELAQVQLEIEENKAILSAREDQALSVLAEEELKTLQEKETTLKKELEEFIQGGVVKLSSTPKSENGAGGKVKAIIVEIRAGVGGQEAALFVADLFKMYLKYAQSRGFKHKILDSGPTELGGYKEIVFELSGVGIYEEMQHEGGVHRVQRIPTTEKSGRIHTSTCSVAILPKPEKTQIKIKPGDLKTDTFRASGPGGQNVNRRETAVRITHLPTNIVVTSQTERNQLQNKENAMVILEAKLLERHLREEEEKLHGTRKAQIKWAKRSEKIRTYNFPQDRVTDHRIKKSWHNIGGILDGNLKLIITALKADSNE